MSWFTALFSAPKLVDTGANLLEKGAAGIDALFYTDEEKAKAGAETYTKWLEAQKILIAESSVKSITRRILAVMILAVYLLMMLFAAIIWKMDVKWAEWVLGLANSNTMSTLVLGVGGLYFMVHVATGVINAKKEN